MERRSAWQLRRRQHHCLPWLSLQVRRDVQLSNPRVKALCATSFQCVQWGKATRH